MKKIFLILILLVPATCLANRYYDSQYDDVAEYEYQQRSGSSSSGSEILFGIAAFLPGILCFFFFKEQDVGAYAFMFTAAHWGTTFAAMYSASEFFGYQGAWNTAWIYLSAIGYSLWAAKTAGKIDF